LRIFTALFLGIMARVVAHFGASVVTCGFSGREGGLTVSRLVLIIISLVVGAVLAVGASVATSALVGSSTPSNQAPYNYGTN
jgi:hypothetical protein